MKPPEVNDRNIAVWRVASLGPSGECVQAEPQPSPLASESSAELMRGLSDAFALVLMNAQVLACKLPSYSRSKRYVHEIERSAQRGGALLKRLLDRLSADAGGSCQHELSEAVPPVAERRAVVANQGPSNAAEGAITGVPSVVVHAAPVFSP